MYAARILWGLYSSIYNIGFEQKLAPQAEIICAWLLVACIACVRLHQMPSMLNHDGVHINCEVQKFRMLNLWSDL